VHLGHEKWMHYFMLGWPRCGPHKMCVGTHYIEFVFLHPIRSTGHIVPFGASGPERSIYFSHALGGPQRIPQKSCRDTLHRTYAFASIGIYESCSAFWSIRGAKHQHSIFMLRWDQFRSHKKRTRIRYAELVFLHPVGSLGHVVCSVVPGA
jgi:hypothetical protein